MIIFVVGGSRHCSVSRMVVEEDHTLATKMEGSDLVIFTGGADINPAIYNCHLHHTTSFSPHRDEYEVAAFYEAKRLGIPMAGICRGAQLINALEGGSMYQDVNHHCGHHLVLDIETGEQISLNSIHHQMMMPAKHAELLSYAEGVASYKSYASPLHEEYAEYVVVDDNIDPEALWYSNIKALCFQAHPEFDHSGGSCRTYFFNLLARKGVV